MRESPPRTQASAPEDRVIRRTMLVRNGRNGQASVRDRQDADERLHDPLEQALCESVPPSTEE